MSNMVYLMCSLPSLTFGQVPPISFEDFLEMAKSQLSEKNQKKMEAVDIQKMHLESERTDLKGFVSHYNDVNQDLAEIRKAKAQKRTPVLTTLPQTIADSNPLEREKQIMQWYWDELDAVESGETFSLSELLAYKLKLQFLCRLHSFNEEKGLELLSSIINPSKNKEE